MRPMDNLDFDRLYERSAEEAVAYLEGLGTKITWNWREQWRSYQEKSFTVAKVASADLLQDMLDELRRASKSGVAWNEWVRQMPEMLERRGWSPKKDDGSTWRFDTIFRTNIQSAYQAGRYDRMQQSDVFEFWEYRAVGDKRTRPAHRELDGLILPKSHPFWSRVFPPNGYSCRCSVTALTAAQARRRGYREPEGNKAVTPSGEIVDLEEWLPDEGFVGVPGKVVGPNLKKYDPALRRRLETDLRSRSSAKTSPARKSTGPKTPAASPPSGSTTSKPSPSAAEYPASPEPKTKLEAGFNAAVRYYRENVLSAEDARRLTHRQVLEKFEADYQSLDPKTFSRAQGAEKAQIAAIREFEKAEAARKAASRGYSDDDVELASSIMRRDLEVVERFHKQKTKGALELVEHAAVHHYTGSGYNSLNAALRPKGRGPTKQQLAFVKVAAEAIRKLSKPYSNLTRVIKLSGEELERFLREHEVGQRPTYKAFTSTSTKEHGVFSGNVHIRFEGEWRSGANVARLSQHPDEAEVLFAPGLEVEVTDVREVEWLNGVTRYYVTVKNPGNS